MHASDLAGRNLFPHSGDGSGIFPDWLRHDFYPLARFLQAQRESEGLASMRIKRRRLADEEAVVLIADAGATHIRALVSTIKGRVLGRGRSGAGNAFAIGGAAAGHNLKQALTGALRSARISPAQLSIAVVGSAGVTHDGHGATRVAEGMRSYLDGSPILVVGDCLIALEGALAASPGVVAVCGTGSIVLGRNPKGTVLRTGGWGPLAGDEGSAQWVGRRALQVAAHSFDGVGGPTSLSPLLCRYFRLRDFSTIIDTIYAHPMTPSELGKLAPVVSQAAEEGDPAARAIFVEGARALASQLAAAVRRLRLRRPRVSFQGSMFTVKKHFRAPFEKEIRLQLPTAQISAPVLTPLGGAFLLALEACHRPTSPEALDAFRSEPHD